MIGLPSVFVLLMTLTAARGGTTAAARLDGLELPPAVRDALARSLPLAQERIGGQRACGALFTRLGAEGTARLAATSYRLAAGERGGRSCRRGVHALTAVGGTVVALCPSFARLTAAQAALILIHEALHSAGQTEYPSDPAAPDSRAITRMVMEGCRLF